MAKELLTFDELDMSAFSPIETEEVDEKDTDDEEGFVSAEKLKQQETEKDEPKTEETEENTEEVISESVGEEEGNEEEDTDESSKSQPNLYSSLAKVLAEEGVLPTLDFEKGKIESVEDLIEAVKAEIKNNEYSDLTEDQKLYLEVIRSGVPVEEFKQKQQIYQQLNSITNEEIESNEELRKQIILQDFLIKGYSQEKALKLTERSISIGEDVTDAEEALESLKEFEKVNTQKQIEVARLEKQKQEEDNKKQLETFKKTLYETKEIIPGVKVTPKIAEKVFEQATKPVYQLPNGQMVNAVAKARLDNPIEFESKLNYFFYLTKGFTDFSKIATSQKTKAVKELDDLVKGNTFAPRSSQMGGDFDYVPTEMKGDLTPEIIGNIL